MQILGPYNNNSLYGTFVLHCIPSPCFASLFVTSSFPFVGLSFFCDLFLIFEQSKVECFILCWRHEYHFVRNCRLNTYTHHTIISFHLNMHMHVHTLSEKFLTILPHYVLLVQLHHFHHTHLAYFGNQLDACRISTQLLLLYCGWHWVKLFYSK